MTVGTATDTSATQSLYQSLTVDTVKEKSKTDDAQSRFLKLLTAQLKNQDPLNPVDNAQTTSQLAQISTVDGIERLNETLKGLVGSYRNSETLQAAALVGHQILVDGDEMNFTDGFALAGFDLSAAADKVKISIRDANGIEVASEEMTNQEKGINNFVWDGTTANGAVAANGNYTIKVTATKGSADIPVDSLEMATVVSVMNGESGATISAGRFGKLSLSDIRSIL